MNLTKLEEAIIFPEDLSCELDADHPLAKPERIVKSKENLWVAFSWRLVKTISPNKVLEIIYQGHVVARCPVQFTVVQVGQVAWWCWEVEK